MRQRIKLALDGRFALARSLIRRLPPESRFKDEPAIDSGFGEPPEVEIPNLSLENKTLSIDNTNYEFENPIEAKTRYDIINRAFEVYENHHELPYVWGGSSPWSRKRNHDSKKFRNVPLRKYQPSGSFRSGNPIEPGFDCTGFLWYVMNDVNIPEFKRRRISEEYRQETDLVGESLAGNHINSIENNALPGDIVFLMDSKSKNAVHVGIYIGDGKLLDCAAKKKVDHRLHPDDLNEWHERYDEWDIEKRGGLDIRNLSQYKDYHMEIRSIKGLKN